MGELSYKGFSGSVEASLEDNCLVGEILFINDHIVYEGQTVSEVTHAFHQAVDQYLDYCARNKKTPDKPYSGSFNVRLGPRFHRLAAQKAYRIGASLNEYVLNCIKKDLSSEVTQADVAKLAASWANFAVVNRPNQYQTNAYNSQDTTNKIASGIPPGSVNAEDIISNFLN